MSDAQAPGNSRSRCDEVQTREHPQRFAIRRGRKRLPARIAPLVAAMLLTAQPANADDTGASAPPLTDPCIVNAWRALRAADCARCHGKDYEGLAAPSIVGYARSSSREAFVRMILDGAQARGMPAYRLNPSIADHVDDIHRYFIGRADGTIHAESRPQQ